MIPVPRSVLYVTDSPFVGGAERSLIRIASGLDQTRFRPFVAAACSDDFSDAVRDAGLPLRRITLPRPSKSWPVPFVSSVWRLRRQMQQLGISLVHVNDAPAFRAAAVAARSLRIPLVTHIRYPYGAAAFRWLFKGPFRQAIVASAFMKAYVQSECPELFPPEKCRVIHNGFDPPPPPGAARLAALAASLGLLPGQTVVAFVGQVIEIKGVREFLIAARAIRDEFPGCRFLVVGDDKQQHENYRVKMEQLRDDLGLRDVCRFTGYRTDVWDLLHLADLVLMPSHIEPLGNVALEAAAAARPIVAACVGGLPEIVRPDHTGLLVPPREPETLAHAAATILRSPERLRDMGRDARAHVLEHFPVRRQIDQLQELYTEVASRSATDR